MGSCICITMSSGRDWNLSACCCLTSSSFISRLFSISAKTSTCYSSASSSFVLFCSISSFSEVCKKTLNTKSSGPSRGLRCAPGFHCTRLPSCRQPVLALDWPLGRALAGPGSGLVARRGVSLEVCAAIGALLRVCVAYLTVQCSSAATNVTRTKSVLKLSVGVRSSKWPR